MGFCIMHATIFESYRGFIILIVKTYMLTVFQMEAHAVALPIYSRNIQPFGKDLRSAFFSIEGPRLMCTTLGWLMEHFSCVELGSFLKSADNVILGDSFFHFLTLLFFVHTLVSELLVSQGSCSAFYNFFLQASFLSLITAGWPGSHRHSHHHFHNAQQKECAGQLPPSARQIPGKRSRGSERERMS